MTDYRQKYFKYKSKYLHNKQKGGYLPDDATIINIDKETVSNTNYRKVIHTTDHSQVVLMRLRPGTEIGMELHSDVDQFIRVEKGFAKCSKDGNKIDYNKDMLIDNTIVYENMIPTGKIINSEISDLPEDHVLLVPRNTWHNVWNPPENSEDVHIYTVYSFGKQNPPHKKDMNTQYEKEDEINEVKN